MNKKLIKNGMTFITINGETYLRCGKRVILLDITHDKIKSFESIKEEDIKHIFKANGELYIDKCGKERKEEKDE